MDKRALLKLFEEQIATDLNVARQAALNAHEAATHAESKAEDPYDTRGLEASYLAGAQSKRAMELEEQVVMFRHVDIREFTAETPIASTAVIELTFEGTKVYYFMMPNGGGRQVRFEGKTISIVTPQSPVGEAILGKKVGDEIEVEIQKKLRDYEITAVW